MLQLELFIGGEFRNGQFTGPGTLTMTDGSVFEGEFRNGLADGLGRLTHADGTFEEGLFRHINDELVHLDIPDVVVLQPPWSRKRYDVERAIAHRPSGAHAGGTHGRHSVFGTTGRGNKRIKSRQ